jgi:type I restriction enzyme S subunit
VSAPWARVPFGEALIDVSRTSPRRLTASEYQSSGTIPVIDQGAKPVAGFSNDPNDAVRVTSPLIIFGDHTKIFKFVDHDFCVGAEGVKMLAPRTNFDALFLFHYLRTVTLPDVGYSRHFKFLERVTIPKPPLGEQRRIAANFDRVDGLRQKSKTAVATIDNLTRSLFNRTCGAKLNDRTSLRAIGDFCTTGSGTTPSRKKQARYYGGGIPWVKSGELREREITSTQETVTEEALNETSLRVVPADTILLAMYGATIGRVGLLKTPATTNQAICQITPDPHIADITFMYYAVQSLANELVARGAGGAQPNINQQIVREAIVRLPSLEQQQHFARHIKRLDRLRLAYNERVTLLEQLFASLQHREFDSALTEGAPRSAARVGLKR